MLDMLPEYSDGETTMNSSQSSSLSSSYGRCSSLSRSSTDAPPPVAAVSKSILSLSAPAKPHRSSSDPAWSMIQTLPHPLVPSDFRLLRRIGRGDIGTVYLCRLNHQNTSTKSPNPLVFAMKVVDKREVEKKKKLGRAEVERRVLRSLDHPFLPTLYADFDVEPHYSCVVVEFCPGGDLHSLRHKQPTKAFSVSAARFYSAEVLVALEYLHFLGVVYRDLKPENVLLRTDGHIMLSDFDLSLESTSSASLFNHSSSEKSVSCFPFFGWMKRRKTKKVTENGEGTSLLVAEPVEATSRSFVGTHEYVAPEVAAGRGHGSGVDWWAFGVFLYELLYGKTPFAGDSNRSTLRNIVKQPLSFPPLKVAAGDKHARDLITKLLLKDPSRRLGTGHGAADVKKHPFFSGVNFALLRSRRPPFVPAAVTDHRSRSSRRRTGNTRFDYF